MVRDRSLHLLSHGFDPHLGLTSHYKGRIPYTQEQNPFQSDGIRHCTLRMSLF